MILILISTANIYWVDAENVFSMQEDGLTSNEQEAVSNEDKVKSGEIPSENQLSDKTAAPPAEGEEGAPFSMFFYLHVNFKMFVLCKL